MNECWLWKHFCCSRYYWQHVSVFGCVFCTCSIFSKCCTSVVTLVKMLFACVLCIYMCFLTSDCTVYVQVFLNIEPTIICKGFGHHGFLWTTVTPNNKPTTTSTWPAHSPDLNIMVTLRTTKIHRTVKNHPRFLKTKHDLVFLVYCT